jgi:hypothetical protein
MNEWLGGEIGWEKRETFLRMSGWERRDKFSARHLASYLLALCEEHVL